MTTPHRATAEQWNTVSAQAAPRWIGIHQCALGGEDSVPSAVLELRARVEALEAVQPSPATEDSSAAASTPEAALVATPPPHGYAYRYPSLLGGTVIEFNYGREINGSRSIEAIPYWLGVPPVDLREPPAAQPAPPVAPADCPTCEGMPSAFNNPCCVCGLSRPAQPAPPVAPAGGLVERVAEVFLSKPFTADDPVGARAVIREVAAWLKEGKGQHGVWATPARDLLQEADRG